MNLAQVEAFLVLAGERHFGRTADRLHLSQPRVSRLMATWNARRACFPGDPGTVGRRHYVLAPGGDPGRAGRRHAVGGDDLPVPAAHGS
jgi:Bacterial regulatory helix-turn-helix protein, lysR family